MNSGEIRKYDFANKKQLINDIIDEVSVLEMYATGRNRRFAKRGEVHSV
jgi:hypothetical protein